VRADPVRRVDVIVSSVRTIRQEFTRMVGRLGGSGILQDVHTPKRRPSKDQAAELLIDWHFQIEPGLEEVFRIISENESSPDEPIKLVEVTTGTISTGRVDAFVFRATPECPYPTVIAELTPKEFELLRRDRKAWPEGWRLETARSFRRQKAA